MPDNKTVQNTKTARLIIICGLPGSGKTTLAKKFEQDRAAIRFCPDDWMDALSLNLYDSDRRQNIEDLQWELTKNLLAKGLTVIIEWGTWAREERDTLRNGARTLGAHVELHYLTATAEVLFKRIKDRAMENPPIAREAVQQWFEILEPPTLEEMALFDPPPT